jgi:hypothetical protein
VFRTSAASGKMTALAQGNRVHVHPDGTLHAHNEATDVQDIYAAPVADAIAQGKPQVIVFATPKCCTGRVCGPVVDLVRTLLTAYGQRVVFTHQEI